MNQIKEMKMNQTKEMKIDPYMYETSIRVVSNEKDEEVSVRCELAIYKTIKERKDELRDMFTAVLKHGCVGIFTEGHNSEVVNLHPHLDVKPMLERIGAVAAIYNCHCDGEMVVTDDRYPSRNVTYFFEDWSRETVTVDHNGVPNAQILHAKTSFETLQEARQAKRRIHDLECEVIDLEGEVVELKKKLKTEEIAVE